MTGTNQRDKVESQSSTILAFARKLSTGTDPRKVKPPAERRSSLDLKYDDSRKESIEPATPRAQTNTQTLQMQKKRKLLNTSITGDSEIYKKKKRADFFTLKETIDMITKIGADLQKYLEQNTKKEVKELVKRLAKQIKNMNENRISD
ncbi:unnamed protein product [Ceutorhynchus assimilis]|uniref:Uncharacterized protein n=1 Tax=Ceutorhynchus assimilis TaxID=467358 RepID=A0A9N9MHD3_9CUCU|nr:unnamed protein product [Ceutorhynchus assimilis]